MSTPLTSPKARELILGQCAALVEEERGGLARSVGCQAFPVRQVLFHHRLVWLAHAVDSRCSGSLRHPVSWCSAGLSESPESIWIAADTIDPGPPQVVPPCTLATVPPNRLAPPIGTPPAPGAQERGAPPPRGITFTMPEALRHVVRDADEPGPLGRAADEGQRPAELVTGLRRARHACAVLGVAGLGIEVRDREHLDHALVGGGPVLGRDTHRESGGHIAEAGSGESQLVTEQVARLGGPADAGGVLGQIRHPG